MLSRLKTTSYEWVLLIALFGFHLVLLQDHLFWGKALFPHDNFSWDYPLFHFFANSLVQGTIPFWNPYEHTGEPFYMIFGQIRLMDPLTLLHISIGSLFTNDTVTLFNWHRFLQIFWMQMGVYWLFRKFISTLGGRALLQAFIFLSTSMVNGFRESGAIHLYLYLPFIVHFLFRILEGDGRWRNWFWLATLTGLNFQSYFFAGTWLFLIFFGASVLVLQRGILQKALSPRWPWKMGCAAVILSLMTAPNLMMLKEQKEYIYPARAVSPKWKEKLERRAPYFEYSTRMVNPDGVGLDYQLMATTGTAASLWDYLNLGVPPLTRFRTPLSEGPGWGNVNPFHTYFGMLGFFFILAGIFLGKDRLKPAFISTTILLVWMSLGSKGLLHAWLFPFLPPLWFFRHTLHLMIFFDFVACYFGALGIEASLQLLARQSSRPLRDSIGRAFTSRFRVIFVVLVSMGGWGIPQLFREFQTPVPSLFVVGLTTFLTLTALLWGKEVALFTAVTAILGWIWGLAASLTYLRKVWALAFFAPFLIALVGNKTFRFLSLAKNLKVSLLFMGLAIELALFSLVGRFNYRMPRPDPQKAHTVLHSDSPKLLPRTLTRTALTDARSGEVMRYTATLKEKPAAFPPFLVETDTTHPPNLRFWDVLLVPKSFDAIFRAGLSIENLSAALGIERPPLSFYTEANEQPQTKMLETIRRRTDDAYDALMIEGDERRNPETNRGLPFTGEVLHFSPNQLEVSVVAAQDGFLLWRDGFHPYWRASVDGLNTPIHLSNFLFKSVALTKGTHHVSFWFDPWPVKLAWILFYLPLGFAVMFEIFLALKSVNLAPLENLKPWPALTPEGSPP